MCGFVGVINKDRRPVDPSVLTGMAETIRHRGPDQEGGCIKDWVGFYHHRLSIIDESGGKQPLTSGGQTIVLNGEIYNYLELREELKRAGYVFATQSDTEVLLHMYQEYGSGCLQRLIGMFAFIIHDADRNALFAARDHFGIKPLYYHDGLDHLLFASEIKALLAHPSVPAEPDYTSIP